MKISQLDLHEGRVVVSGSGGLGVGRLWLRYDDAGIAEAGLHVLYGDAVHGATDAVRVGAVSV